MQRVIKMNLRSELFKIIHIYERYDYEPVGD